MTRFQKWLFLFREVFRIRAFLTFLDFLIYRTPLGYRWSRLCGYDFHKSTIIWINEQNGIHTRLTLLLPRFLYEFPGMKTLDLEFELYDLDGHCLSRWEVKNVTVYKEWGLDTKVDPHIPRSFEGSLLIKQRLHLEDQKFIKAAGGLFSVANTYIEYYKEGSFITVTHDYSAFLPDQGIHFKPVGMIPAYCDDLRETHVILHAAKGGIKKRDIQVTLFNKQGDSLTVPFPPLKPHATKRFLVSEFFPTAGEFLNDEVGQVELKGNFRYLFARAAYGFVHKKSGTFSFDHCFYSVFKHSYIADSERNRFQKGFFNPFFVLEDDRTSTSIALFHKSEYPYDKEIDLLVYDEGGKCVAELPSYRLLRGDTTERIEIGPILKQHGISGNFLGHAEVLYHRSSRYPLYPNYLDLIVEYQRGEAFAHVLFGSKLWNSSQPLALASDQRPTFGCRVVCNEVQTTYIAISNCSHDYRYPLEVHFTVNLIVHGKVVESRRHSIRPEATLYRSIEDFFPDAEKRLLASQGSGLFSYTIHNSSLLATIFLTVDRVSQSLSVEHTLEVPNFEIAQAQI